MQDLTKIKKAMEHVRQYYPEVEIVVFNKEGRWQYMDGDFNSPKFDDKVDHLVDVGLLEEAANSVETCPFVYQI